MTDEGELFSVYIKTYLNIFPPNILVCFYRFTPTVPHCCQTSDLQAVIAALL